MGGRLIFAICLTALALQPASKKNVATATGENEDLRLTVTMYLEKSDVKELTGSDLGGHYFIADVKVEPKYGKTVSVERDDFLLRTDKDGEKAQPFAASQVAGRGALIVSQVTDNTGVGSPGWTGATGPVIRGGGMGSGGVVGSGGDVDTSRPQVKAQKDEKENPLKKTLDAKSLPEGNTDKPVTGLLYFPMEKQKMKDLELTFGGKENRITLRFKS